MILNSLKKFSLLQSLLVMIIVSLLLPLPVLLGTYVNIAYNDSQEKRFELHSKKVELTSKVFTEALWNYYPELANTMLEQLSLDENIVFVTVKDDRNQKFLSWRNKHVDKINVIDVFKKDLIKNNKTIGNIEIHFKKVGLVESIISDLRLFWYVFFLQIVFMITIVSFIYYFKVLQPIKRLLGDAKKLSDKELDEEFVWQGKDEIGILGTAFENTRKSLKHLFDTLVEQNETLDDKVKQRTQELEDANKYKSEFLANMSHEIRTPMNAIVGMCHLINQTDLNATQLNYTNKIKDASSILLYLINDILDFSKIEAGKIEIEDVAFDLHKELKKTLSIFSVLAKEKNLKFEVDYINTHRFFKGDPYRINQILNNFLSNAIKFTNEGSVFLKVEEEITNDDTHKLKFSVSDSGIGINNEKKDKLFCAFMQADSSTTRQYGGTGLGLFISTQLANMMNGTLSVDSEENKGSTFSFELDITPVNGSQLQHEFSKELFNPLNILLIEDNKNSVLILEDFIRSFGFFVTSVSSYEQALEKVEKSNYDLFIIDFHLPTIDGISTYENLKDVFNNKNVPPAIMITVDDDVVIKRMAIESNFKEFLVKPINPSSLYDDIIEVCDVVTSKLPFDPKEMDLSLKKILLVEDNEINLEVAQCLLEDTKAQVDVARNGHDAVLKVKENSYDVIFMDIQMPIMDGLEATAVIRNELKSLTPIIAMTANVMAHDVEKCLKIGMDDHIGKPFDLEDFYETLLNLFGKDISYKHKKVAKISEDKVLDKDEAVRRLGKSEKLWQKMVDKFYIKYNIIEDTLNDFIENKDIESMKIYLHTLRGLAGSIGAKRLAQEVRALEFNLDIENMFLDDLFLKQKELFKVLQTYTKGNINV